MANARKKHPELHYVASLDDAVVGADIVMLLTEWDEFKKMSPELIGQVVARRNLVDGRNVLNPVEWRSAGWQYRALGRP